MQRTNNLAVARRARQLAAAIYALTARFPPSERFGLAVQMRKAAVSIGSNIAEGCGRQGDASLIAFLHIALGSASELEFQLRLASDVGITTAKDISAPLAQLAQLMTMLTRLIQSLRRGRRKQERSTDWGAVN